METYPDRFTTDFEHNKEMLENANLESKWVRNRLAGYITKLMKRRESEGRVPASED